MGHDDAWWIIHEVIWSWNHSMVSNFELVEHVEIFKVPRPIPEQYTPQLNTLIQRLGVDQVKDFQILWKGHVTMSQSGIWGFRSLMYCSIVGFSSYFPECSLWPHPTCFRRMLEKKDKPRPSVKELIDDPYVQATTWSNCCMVSGLLHILWPFSIFQ